MNKWDLLEMLEGLRNMLVIYERGEKPPNNMMFNRLQAITKMVSDAMEMTGA